MGERERERAERKGGASAERLKRERERERESDEVRSFFCEDERRVVAVPNRCARQPLEQHRSRKYERQESEGDVQASTPREVRTGGCLGPYQRERNSSGRKGICGMQPWTCPATRPYSISMPSPISKTQHGCKETTLLWMCLRLEAF